MLKLAAFKNLEELNLSRNPINKLPTNLSSLAKLTNLNLSDVPLSDIHKAVDSLETLP
jgi:Leucine-rich repeat (LRR) protein